MKNLSFNDGRESFMVNDDPDRVIRFNPADPEIINRILGVQKYFQKYEFPDGIELNPDGTPKNDIESSAGYIALFTNEMRKSFNDIFNEDVYDTIFDRQSPLCIVGDKYLFEAVLDAMIDIMKPAIDAYNRKNQKKMNKYLGDIK